MNKRIFGLLLLLMLFLFPSFAEGGLLFKTEQFVFNGKTKVTKAEVEEKLGGNDIDMLYSQVLETLGIYTYNLHVQVVLCKDQKEVSKIFKKLACFDGEFNQPAFYSYETNSLYVAYPELRLGIFVHEITHIVLCHYFVISPLSSNIQEILSGYSEYTILKGLNVKE